MLGPGLPAPVLPAPALIAGSPVSTDITPLEHYLAEQADLSAVDRFAKAHDSAGQIGSHQSTWNDLVPLSRPAPGQQYRFAVDLDACTGCKACVTACHNVNGLDPGESHRSVGLLTAAPEAPSFQQTVTSACHHCADPACLSGCPTNAYEKDPFTGIVAHLEGRCLGCGYCTWMCPYEVPKMNAARGVVRKCDMCQDRLKAGEAPACVSACPSEAISIGLVDAALLTAALMEPVLVPGAPPSIITRPATVYRSEWGLPQGLVAADAQRVRLAHGHLPLVAMLVLTQMSMGALAFDVVLRLADSPARRSATMLWALAAGGAGVVASLAHLGKPSRAWRAGFGIRHSWLSREAVAFSAFAVLAVVAAAGGGLMFEALALVAGVGGVACSAMLYAVTERPWWRLRWTALRFAMSALVGGGALLRATAGDLSWQIVAVNVLIVTASLAKLAWELAVLRRPDMASVAAVCRRELPSLRRARVSAGVMGAVVTPALVLTGVLPPVAAWVGLGLVLAGELAERYQFFAAASWSGMPGPAQH